MNTLETARAEAKIADTVLVESVKGVVGVVMEAEMASFAARRKRRCRRWDLGGEKVGRETWKEGSGVQWGAWRVGFGVLRRRVWEAIREAIGEVSGNEDYAVKGTRSNLSGLPWF